MTIKSIEKELANYKDEPIVGQWQDYADLRTCADCGNQTNIYDCYIYIAEYYCSECCPDEYGEEVEQ